MRLSNLSFSTLLGMIGRGNPFQFRLFGSAAISLLVFLIGQASVQVSNAADLLESLVGTWQFEDREVWIVIHANGSAIQCRIAPDNHVYFSKGAFQAPNFIDWQDFWGRDQVARGAKDITLTGENGAFKYMRANEEPSRLCSVAGGEGTQSDTQ
jgi:hypothetical protein